MAPKVLHVSEANEWTGGTAQLLLLAEGLKAKGWDVAVGCRPGSGLSQHAAARGLPTFLCGLREDYDLLSALELARHVREKGIDVVHAHHNRSHAVCLLAQAILALQGRRAVLVVSRRVSFAPGKNPFSLWKYRSALIDRIVAVADAVKDVLVAAGVPAERVAVIRSGTDVSRFVPRRATDEQKRALGLPVGAPLVGKIANASPWKGQSSLLEAAKRLADRGSPARFVLAGRDTDGPWVRELVERHGLRDRVTLLGFRTDVPDILSALDVSVNAAVKGEGLSGALRESLLMGVPVVASDIAGNRELLREGSGGWLYPSGDAAALADRLEWVLAHRAEAAAAVKAWQQRAQGEFTLDQTVARTDALYRELLGQRGGRTAP
jgi:glycosyltransferase involved in cell wall biosynthesis